MNERAGERADYWAGRLSESYRGTAEEYHLTVAEAVLDDDYDGAFLSANEISWGMTLAKVIKERDAAVNALKARRQDPGPDDETRAAEAPGLSDGQRRVPGSGRGADGGTDEWGM